MTNTMIIDEIRKLIDGGDEGKSITTGELRKLSNDIYKKIDNKNIENILFLCEELLQERKWSYGVIAYYWADKSKKLYNEETFGIFEKWLMKYVRDWGDCDDFCTHAFAEVLMKYPEQLHRVISWKEHPNFPVRRAMAVVTIPMIKKEKINSEIIFKISDLLMYDKHYLVLKGYGWMLKVLSEKEPESVFEYLIRNKSNMPRTAFRYALEKLDIEKKNKLMGK